MAEGKKSRRRFLTELVMLGGGLSAAALLAAKASHSETSEGKLNPAAFSQIHTYSDLCANASTFAGQPVKDYVLNQRLQVGTAYRLRSGWDEDTMISNLELYLASLGVEEMTALVIGAWFAGDPDRKPDQVLATLLKNRAKLPNLAAIYFGDIISEEFEMSWIQQTDLSPLLEAFPSLELLRSRGGVGLSYSKIEHKNLRALAIESGGLDGSVIRSLSASKLPNLEYLELWLGTVDYGGNASLEDLKPILEGDLFPKLRYLGLRNSDKADMLAQAAVSSPLSQRIEVLDLSLGTLSDEGGEALLKLESQSVKKLLLHHHYLSQELTKKLQASAYAVDVTNPQYMETNPEDRYVAVGE